MFLTRPEELHEGYNIIIEESREDLGMGKSLRLLNEALKAVQQKWDTQITGQPRSDDDPSAGKNCYISFATVFLKKKS